MTLLFHASDLHFGAEDRDALGWFAGEVQKHRPDAVIVTGDLTMQARRREFAAAARWLGELDVPVSLHVGNHDLPYFNLFERFFRPYRRFARLRDGLETRIDLAHVHIVPLKTTARAQWRLNWSKVRVGSSALHRTARTLAPLPRNDITLVACHHPLIDPDTPGTARTRGGAAALARLAGLGATAILSGHVHDPFDRAHATPHGPIRLIGAGTLSERVRATPPSYNRLSVDDGILAVSVHRAG